jgi:hypothetical protein
MTTLINTMPSAHNTKILEIRHEIGTDYGGKEYLYYSVYADNERLASIFGQNGELPSLVLPDGKVRVGG